MIGALGGRLLCLLGLHAWLPQVHVATEGDARRHTLRVRFDQLCRRCPSIRKRYRPWIGDSGSSVRAEIRRVKLGRP